MKKQLLFLFLTLLFPLTACSNQKPHYSNLQDLNSKREVEQILVEHNINQKNINLVFDWMDDYNAIVTSKNLTKDFQPLPQKGMDYSNIQLNTQAKSFAYLQPINCRITAFSLLKDKIHTNAKPIEHDEWLMFDTEALTNNKQLQCSSQELKHFQTLFNKIDVSFAKTIKEQEEQIIKALHDRDIKINTDQASLICIYLHSPMDHVRFVGHTGVLFKTDKGYLFFEKYSAMDPFQATTFTTKKQVKQYLLSRNDLYGDENELDPIITENNQIMR